MDTTDVIEIVTNKLDRLAATGQLAGSGYAPLDVITRDHAGVLHVQPFPRAHLEEVMDYLMFYLQEKRMNVREVFLVTDCYTDPTLGTTFSDVVVIVHCRANNKVSVGLIEYDPRSNPLLKKEVNWTNPHWYQQMSALGLTLSRQLSENMLETVG
jgi:hypothetical protein